MKTMKIIGGAARNLKTKIKRTEFINKLMIFTQFSKLDLKTKAAITI